MKKYLYASIILIPFFTLLSCSVTSGNGDTIKGDKDIVEKIISISEYSSIEFSLAGDIHYEQNESAPAYLRIEIDNNLFEILDINVKGETLHIDSKDRVSIKPSKFIMYTNSKVLKGISISGVGKVYAKGKVKSENLKLSLSGVADFFFDNLEAQKTDCYISGVGDINLTGTSNSSYFNISGCGDINAKEFIVTTADCKVSGVGDITVNAKDSLQASVSGVGGVKHVGEPTISKSISVSGMGKIKSVK